MASPDETNAVAAYYEGPGGFRRMVETLERYHTRGADSYVLLLTVYPTIAHLPDLSVNQPELGITQHYIRRLCQAIDVTYEVNDIDLSRLDHRADLVTRIYTDERAKISSLALQRRLLFNMSVATSDDDEFEEETESDDEEEAKEEFDKLSTEDLARRVEQMRQEYAQKVLR